MSQNIRSISLKISFLIMAFFPFSAFADAASKTTDNDLLKVFDSVDKSFLTITTGWVNVGESYARTIFFSLALISILKCGCEYVLYKKDIKDLFDSLLTTLIILCGFLAVIQYAPSWTSTIFLKSFEFLGTKITSINTLTPTGIVDQGIDLVVQILNHAPVMSFLQIFNTLTLLISCICIFLCFFYLGMELLITKLQAYIVMYGCIVFLGFSGVDKLRFMAISYLKSALHVGIKLFIVYLLVAAGTKTTDMISNIISQNHSYVPSVTGLLIVSSTCLSFVVMVKRVSAMASEFLSGVIGGSASEKIGAAVQGATTVATLGKSGVIQKTAQVAGNKAAQGAAHAAAAAKTFRNGASKGDTAASKFSHGMSNLSQNTKDNIGQKASKMGRQAADNFKERMSHSVFRDRNPSESKNDK